jgi:hypothetical protein
MVGEGHEDAATVDLAGKRRRNHVPNYSEANHKKVNAEDDDDSYDSADDESFEGDDDEGQTRERYRWGGTRPSDWNKDEAKKLVSVLHTLGYGNVCWSRVCAELGAKNSHGEQEVSLPSS